jgi:bacterioferritin-associated ferredoxin
VYICLCNGLTASQIAQVVAQGVARPREVYAACNCRAQCGGCTRTIISILREGADATGGPAPRG